MNNNNNNNNKRRHHHNGKNRNRQRYQTERPSINKVYDSNGPAGKQRGTASTLYEKYTTLARDANSAGDRVLSENHMQHAEHYLRIVNSIQEQMQSAYREHQYPEATPSHSFSETEQMNSELENDTETDNSISEMSYSQNSEDQSHENNNSERNLRRKTYPYARRRNTDSRFSKDQETASTTKEISSEMMAPASQDAQTTPPESIEKPRRVVRRRPAKLSETTNSESSQEPNGE